MGKKIVILNGSPRAKGNTNELINSFIEGAKQAGHEIVRFDLQRMNIHPCLGCLGGGHDKQNPCVQKDDMASIYPHYETADVLVLASPMYYWSITAQLKAVIDRLFAVTEKNPNYHTPMQHCVLLMAAEGNTQENFEPIEHYYHSLVHHLGWENLGEVYAGGVMQIGDIKGHLALAKAQELGRNI